MSDETAKAIRLLLVDDQNLFLESLKLVLTSLAPDFAIVGTALDGAEAIQALEKTEADIVLMDVYMPVMDGVAAVAIIAERFPKVDVIMLTTFEDDEYVTEALANGAKGYLLKNIAPQMLISAIRAVRSGSVLIAPDIATSLALHLRQKTNRPRGLSPTSLPDWFYDLSPKERKIVKLILRGLSNKEIAAEINVGEQTIRNYVSKIYDKLGVPDRKGVITLARDLPPFYPE